MNPDDKARLKNLRRRANRARNFPENTCSASRHLHMIAEVLATGCEDYKTERFARVEHDGAACVMEPAEAEAMVAESVEQYTVTPVFLTRDQFERMGEFYGF